MRGANQDVGIDRPRDLLSNAVRSDRGYAWAHYTSLAVALIVLLFASRGLWFFYDEWDFISSRGLHHPALGLFAPHNEHWSTLPILSYRVLLTRLHTYLPYLLVLFLVHSCWCTEQPGDFRTVNLVGLCCQIPCVAGFFELVGCHISECRVKPGVVVP